MVKAKKIIAGIAALALVTSSIPMESISSLDLPVIGKIIVPKLNLLKAEKAHAAEEFTSDLFTYTVSDEQATIVGYASEAKGDIVIPETLDDYPVVAIGYSAFSNQKRMTSVSIPKSVTEIDSCAFSDCISLSSVTLGGVQTIGQQVFDGCTALKSITIPNTLTNSDGYYSDSSYAYG
ncbi:MAG: leucine-rich repeat domain-containing protein, partial [Ruminococcus sp.]|nr:leucine-rich repeat domain-containing protein [Ruminococcus sp.]